MEVQRGVRKRRGKERTAGDIHNAGCGIVSEILAADHTEIGGRDLPVNSITGVNRYRCRINIVEKRAVGRRENKGASMIHCNIPEGGRIPPLKPPLRWRAGDIVASPVLWSRV